MRTLILTLILGITLFFACTNSVENQPNTTGLSTNPILPSGTISAIVKISNLNCWVEQGQFLVTGICDNVPGEWQKIWLEMIPMDAEGRRLKVNGDTSSIFPTFSDAVPPHGRTSFFASWPLKAFSGIPDTCIVKGGAALPVSAGPILVATERSAVKMLVPGKETDTVGVEVAWQVNVVVDNPLNIRALHPRVELLIFGKEDKRLWFATVLNPEDEQQKTYVNAEREGPMEAQEKRRIGATVYYANLPQALKDQKIDHVEFHPFDARQ